MKLFLQRFSDNGDATLGHLSVNSKFFCFVVEDEYRGKKVKGDTRIPAGKFRIERTYESGLLKRMQDDWFKGDWIPTICDVPNFKYIRIHPGLTEKHTDGCPLVGYNVNARTHAILSGTTRPAFKDLWKLMDEAFERGEEVWIYIRDEQ